MELSTYSPEKVSGYSLDLSHVETWIEKLANMSKQEREYLSGMDPRRADLVLPGCIIIERLFQKFQVPKFIVMDRGIRFGKLFDKLRGFVPPISFGV